jgi:serine/threonine protein kinase
MPTSTTTLRGARHDPEQWTRLNGVLAEAIERSAEERSALLRQRLGDDRELLQEAEALLRHLDAVEEQPSDVFEDCADHATRSLWSEDAANAGRRIGAYRIVRELGRGGMGTVYLAERADGAFEKQVAIKILKRGTDTDDVLLRFAAERHILARLEHPNIARLLDAGTTDDGLPYFVMEYVAGAPVTQYVREHEFPIEQTIALFLKICAAVEVAHRSRVIHRDLKPSNILVNADGEPKLLDFGIAKLLSPGENSADVTASGETRLTPICASPEQTDGRPITEASDVYALGALLYELLSGQKPYRFSTAHPSREEITRVIREQEPVLPSAVASEPQTARLLRGKPRFDRDEGAAQGSGDALPHRRGADGGHP